MNVKAKSTFSLYFLQQKPNKACCSTKVISGGYIKTRAKYLDFDFHPQQTRGYMQCAVQQPQHVVLCNESSRFLPVGEEGTDDVFGISGDLDIVWEVEGVFMVHDLTVGSHQRVGVERCVTWSQLQKS